MLGGAREFRYDWILLRARDLPHEAGARRPSCSARRSAVFDSLIVFDPFSAPLRPKSDSKNSHTKTVQGGEKKALQRA